MPIYNYGERYEGKVWRYMEFTKFLDMLTSKSLFFPSPATLQKTDPYECQIGRGAFLLAHKDYQNISDEELTEEMYKLGFPPNSSLASARQALSQGPGFWLSMAKTFNQDMAVSCWHAADIESFTMWAVYLNSKPGVAVVADAKFLEEFGASIPEVDAAIGLVNYLDFDLEVLNPGNFWSPIFSKRIFYQSEREFRLAIHKKPYLQTGIPQSFQGMKIPIDPNQLIQEVWLPPFSEEWQSDTLHETIKALGLEVPIKFSRLRENPPTSLEDRPSTFFVEREKDSWVNRSTAGPMMINRWHVEEFVDSAFIHNLTMYSATTKCKEGLTVRDLVHNALFQNSLIKRKDSAGSDRFIIVDIDTGRKLNPTDGIAKEIKKVGFILRENVKQVLGDDSDNETIATYFEIGSQFMRRGLRGTKQ